jgi:peptidoglycan/xylan/chitin deacetylase (PgdA/CDA1 family)
MYDVIESELPPLHEFVPRGVLHASSGMTREQIGELAAWPDFEIGSHTIDHPILSRCSPAEAERQMRESQRWLEETSSRRCTAIAYPQGDYTATTLALCAQCGFERGFAVDPQYGIEPALEIPRIGIYSRSTLQLRLKIAGGGAVHTWRRWRAGQAAAHQSNVPTASAESFASNVVTGRGAGR